MTIQKLSDGIFVDTAKIEKIKKLDGVIFDCDGVLVDISNSYDLTIKKTVDFVLNKMADIDLPNFVNAKMIEGFKSTGGFNDEVDVTYSLILSVATAKKLGQKPDEFVFDVIKHSDQTGIVSVERYLDSLNVDISSIRKKLDYPGNHDTNPLYSIFDQIFYGSDLYYKLYKRMPEYFKEKGLINNDVILVTKDLMEKIKKKFGKKIAIVSGRGFVSTEYSLKSLLDEFDIKNSRFLEDEPREFGKPNPQSLVSCIKGLESSCCMFVGDSTEDILMAKKAEELGNQTVFCAIYGTSKDPQSKRNLFEQKNADIILESVDLIPKALNLVKV